MKGIKKILGEKKIPKKTLALIVGAVVVLGLLLFGEFLPQESEITEDKAISSEDYIRKTEKNLEKLLGDIDGAGKVKVMLTIDNCYENVYAKKYDTKAQKTEKETENELSEEYIIVKKGSNNEECLVVKVYEPTIKGVAVISEGADSIKVKTAITDTVCALFDISTAQVSVEKMAEK